MKKSKKIICKKHGLMGKVTFTYNREIVKEVCFLCFAEKTTKGLKDYNKTK